jgi:hypothetical protein
MNPLIQLKQTTSVFLVGIGLVCFEISPAVQAVNPAPDGGYPNFTTAEGEKALFSLSTGAGNTALGWRSLLLDATGSLNTAVGAGTLLANTADRNTATGAGALLSNTSGIVNTASGTFALFSNTTGNENTAHGHGALFSNTTGGANTANGEGALSSNITGNENTAAGAAALAFNTTGGSNTALGFQAGFNVSMASNVICIGARVFGEDVSNTAWIGNVYNTPTVSGTTLPVIVSDGGQLGTAPSSRRFKHEIKPMDRTSESILALKPVTFQYKADKTNTPQFGLVAEEVAAVNPDLVVPDKNGEIYTVRYDAVNAMLLNEFLKEHKTVQEQGATIASLQKQIEALSTGLKKVSAQLELSKSAPQTVLNNQ